MVFKWGQNVLLEDSMSAHRYWRIRMTATVGNAYAFAEIEFRTTAGVALPFSGGTASAAQVYQTPTYAADKATDGNIATLWSGTDTTQPQWWAYDYGVGNAIDVVEIKITARADGSYNQAPTAFTPEWSDDGTTWHAYLPINTAPWTLSTGQVQVLAVTPLTGTVAMMTQIAVEEWAINNPSAFMTQIALEQWASVGGAGFFSARHV
jgi:hypothetical protein